MYIYNCYIFLDCSFGYYIVPFLSLVRVYVLKSIVYDISIATLAFLWFPFAWNVFFPSPHSQSICVSRIELSIL